jgi:hypothetical protein
MQENKPYQNIKFDRRVGSLSKRTISLIAVPAVFTIMWFFLPSGAVYWLVLLLVSALTWISSFGWEKALATFINFLQHQQRT